MKRRLPLIFVAVVTVLCLVAVAVAAVAAGVDGSAVAYSVNSNEVSQATVDHELKWLAGSSAVKKNLKQQGVTLSNSNGSVNAGFAASWLTERITVALFRQAATRRDVKVSSATRARARTTVAKALKGAPGPLLDTAVDFDLYQKALGLDTQAKANSFLQRAFRNADISVDPRYGSWNPRQGVCPPTGCAPTTAGG
jgi:hypothetical protein